MKYFSKIVAALAATTLAFAISPVLPASSSALPSYESRLSVVFTKSETGTGQSRTVQYSATVTDTLGLLIPRANSSTAPIGQEVMQLGLAIGQCSSMPPQRRVGHDSPECTSFIWNSGVVYTSGLSTLTATRTMTGQDLITFEANLASMPLVVPSVAFENAAGEKMRIFDSTVQVSAAPTPTSEAGVSFAGFLISGATGRTVDVETAGTLRFTGKRLNQVASATIGGIAVTVTSATRSALELDFDSLPEGKHDVVLTSKSGAKTTLRGFVIVN